MSYLKAYLLAKSNRYIATPNHLTLYGTVANITVCVCFLNSCDCLIT